MVPPSLEGLLTKAQRDQYTRQPIPCQKPTWCFLVQRDQCPFTISSWFRNLDDGGIRVVGLLLLNTYKLQCVLPSRHSLNGNKLARYTCILLLDLQELRKSFHKLLNGNSSVSTFIFFKILSFQDWFALVGNGSNFNLTMTGEVTFPNLGTPTSYDNFGFCQVPLF